MEGASPRMAGNRIVQILLCGVCALVLCLVALKTFSKAQGCSIEGQPLRVAIVSSAKRQDNIDRYHKVWQLIRDNYYFEDKLSDWDAWEHACDDQLNSPDETRAAISRMVSSLNDDFTYLNEPEVTEQADRAYETPGCVVWRQLSDNTGYIKIDSFHSRQVTSEFKEALKRLSGCRAFVLDLRNNHGGYINLAYKTFSLLAGDRKFASYEGRNKGKDIIGEFIANKAVDVGSHRRSHGKYEKDRDLLRHRPLIVLVNSDTRSAAEMLAGSLRENGLAVLVGSRTFGKGVLQNTYELDDGSSVKIVTARYFLPNGECIHERGLMPDRVVDESLNGEFDGSLLEAMSILRSHRVIAHVQRAVAS